MREEKTLDISWGSVLKIGVLFFLFYIIFLIKEILIFTIFAIIISFLFEPAIEYLKTKKIPRSVSAPIIYLSFFLITGFLVFIFSAPIFSEIQNFSQLIPQYFEKYSPFFQKLGLEAFENFETFTKNFQDWLIKASSSILSAISAIFGGVFSTLLIFSLSFFISVEEGGMERLFEFFLPPKIKDRFLFLLKNTQNRISIWFGIKALGCLFVGILTFIMLKLFRLDYAFSLSLMASFLNIIPILGPFFSGFALTLVALTDSGLKAIFVLIAFILIQMIEGNILIPILTKRFIHLSPAIVLVALLMGGKLFGFWGAILSIPLVAMFVELLKEFFSESEET